MQSAIFLLHCLSILSSHWWKFCKYYICKSGRLPIGRRLCKKAGFMLFTSLYSHLRWNIILMYRRGRKEVTFNAVLKRGVYFKNICRLWQTPIFGGIEIINIRRHWRGGIWTPIQIWKFASHQKLAFVALSIRFAQLFANNFANIFVQSVIIHFLIHSFTS